MLEDGHDCTTQSDKYHDEGYHDHLSQPPLPGWRTHYYSEDFKKRLKIFKFYQSPEDIIHYHNGGMNNSFLPLAVFSNHLQYLQKVTLQFK